MDTIDKRIWGIAAELSTDDSTSFPRHCCCAGILGDLKETDDGPLWDIAVYGEIRR
jgi:hypothetical protein